MRQKNFNSVDSWWYEKQFMIQTHWNAALSFPLPKGSYGRFIIALVECILILKKVLINGYKWLPGMLTSRAFFKDMSHDVRGAREARANAPHIITPWSLVCRTLILHKGSVTLLGFYLTRTFLSVWQRKFDPTEEIIPFMTWNVQFRRANCRVKTLYLYIISDVVVVCYIQVLVNNLYE